MSDPEHMLGNAATASQNISLLDDKVTRGAILRSIVQWLEANEEGDMDFAIFDLKQHPDYDG